MEHVDPQRIEKERLQKLLEEKPNDSRPEAARPDMAVRRQPVQSRESGAILRVDVTVCSYRAESYAPGANPSMGCNPTGDFTDERTP